MIRYRETDRNAFEIDITRCAMQQFAKAHGAEGMLPGDLPDGLSVFLPDGQLFCAHSNTRRRQ